ncbi:MAG: hypothetical protein Q8M37_14350 [Nevskia sp.]|nr:hypothetical protein [Nevskia sp.]
MHELMGQAAGLAGRFLLLQRIDQLYRREEAHALAMASDGLDAQCCGQMRLAGAGAGAADQHDVFGLLGEGGHGESRDLPALDLRLLEVESGQIAMDRKASDVHLVADRAQCPIRALGLHQMLQQRFVGVQRAGAALLRIPGQRERSKRFNVNTDFGGT